MIDSIAAGLQHVTLISVLWVVAGVLLGMVFGVLPGLGSVAGLSIVLPLTYGMDESPAFALVVGIYMGAVYGGSVTAIMLRIPGDAGSIATVYDGYALTQQGRSQYALGGSIGASVTGAILGGIALFLLLPVFGAFALSLDSAAYFWIIAIALIFIAQAVRKDVRKGLIAVTLGIMVGTVGIDPLVGVDRYTMGAAYLLDGFPLLPLVLGMFGIAHMLNLAQSRTRIASHAVPASGGRMGEGLRSVLRYWSTTGRASSLGIVAGAIPGLGASSGNLIAYSNAQRRAGPDGRFGQGDIRGVVAPESCNNATVGPSLVPTLTLGVPGTLSAAVLMGALVLHGLTPGRELVQDHADVLYGIGLFVLISAVVLLPAALGTASTLARISTVPVAILVPAITVLLVFGVFSNRSLLADVLLLVGVGVVGYFLERYGFPSAPLLIAFILGPILEVNMRRAMHAGDGTLAALIDGPFHWLLAVIALLLLARPLLERPLRAIVTRLRRGERREEPSADPPGETKHRG